MKKYDFLINILQQYKNFNIKAWAIDFYQSF